VVVKYFKCPKCGTELRYDLYQDHRYNFCSYCGTEIFINKHSKNISTLPKQSNIAKFKLEYKCVWSNGSKIKC